MWRSRTDAAKSAVIDGKYGRLGVKDFRFNQIISEQMCTKDLMGRAMRCQK